MNKQQVQLAVAGGLAFSFAAGSVGGYFFAKKQLVDDLTQQFEERLESEVAGVKTFYKQLNKQDEFSDPEKLAEKYRPVETEEALLAESVTQIKTLEYGDGEAGSKQSAQEVLEVIESQGYTEVVEGQTHVVNVFSESSDDQHFDIDAERLNRSPEEPYILSEEEFLENDGDYEQLQFTYFEADEVLMDEGGIIRPESDLLIGDQNLEKFGYGSNDRNLLYVRNEGLELDFMVTRHNGSYTKVVAGFDDSLEHSAMGRRPRKFRRYDE